MNQPQDPNAAEAAPAATAHKSLWERILTYTPVAMAAVATVLAGMSSSEMTRAQYFRSLAGQTQAKVGDQWAFFQAKRTRKLVLDQTSAVLDTVAVPAPLDPTSLNTLAGNLPGAFRRAESESQQLLDALGKAENSLGNDGPPLRAAAERLLQTTRTGTAAADQLKTKTWGTIVAHHARDSTPDVFTCLKTGEPPPVEESFVSDQNLSQAHQAIADRKSADEIDKAVAQVKPELLQAAMNEADATASRFDVAVNPVEKEMHGIDELIGEQVRLTREFYRAARDLKAALAWVDESKLPRDLRAGVDRLEREATGLRTSADEWNVAFKAASNRFTGHRYDREAHYNQELAYLYEIEVHQHSLRSDRHLERSHHFFYGLLAAQVAVTIASLALAVRQKSLLWALASVAGVGAVVYGVYVYLAMVA